MGGKSSGGGTQTTKTEPWEAQQPYLKDLFAQAQNYFNAPRGDLQASSALARQGIAKTTGAAENVQPFLDTVQGANQRLVSGEFLDPSSNPALQEYINASNSQITKQFTEGVLPSLTSGAAATGNIGSSRQGVAEGISAGKTLDAIQRNTAQQQTAAYGQGLRAYTAGVALAPQTAGLSSLPGDLYATGAARQYEIDQLPGQQDLDYLNAYKNLVGGGYGGTSTTQAPGTRSGGVSGALGGAATGAGIAASFGPAGYAAAPYAAAAGAIAGYFS